MSWNLSAYIEVLFNWQAHGSGTSEKISPSCVKTKINVSVEERSIVEIEVKV